TSWAIGGRPGRRCVYVQRRSSSRRCHRSSVSGPTGNTHHERRDSRRLSAASTTRSCGSNRGRPTRRPRVATPGRRTRISSSFERSPARAAPAAPAADRPRRTPTTQATATSKGTGTPTPPRRQRPRSITRPNPMKESLLGEQTLLVAKPDRGGPFMLYVGLDLSRKRLDFNALRPDGERFQTGAVPADA